MKYFINIICVFFLSIISCNQPDLPTATQNNNGYTGNGSDIDFIPYYTWPIPSGTGELFMKLEGSTTYYNPNPANFIKPTGSSFAVIANNKTIGSDSIFTFNISNGVKPGVVYTINDLSTNNVTLLVQLDTVIQNKDTIVTFNNFNVSGLGKTIGKCLILSNTSSQIEGKFYADVTDPDKNKVVKIRDAYFKFIKP